MTDPLAESAAMSLNAMAEQASYQEKRRAAPGEVPGTPHAVLKDTATSIAGVSGAYGESLGARCRRKLQL
jgi:hypothetical protein